LPLAQALSKKTKVVGFDNDRKKIEKLNQDNSSQNLIFTDNTKCFNQAGFIIICVPTPVNESKEPDLSLVENATKIIGQNMQIGSIVILESTVYPGYTEEVMKPILETESGLKCGKDFKIAYSPERINPGDTEHTLERITKVVSGMDHDTTEMVAELYSEVTPHIFIAKNIKTAEAAKAIENIQRDLNIALVNELSLIFQKIDINTIDVLDAAATKWNFQRYSPGLVGGHCIPVDPYYLVYKAKALGYNPQVILAGRALNDSMPKHIAEMAIKALNINGKVIRNSKVLIMGLTYKENVSDIRETPVRGIISELKEYLVQVLGYDPHIDELESLFGIKALNSLDKSLKVDCVILATAHNIFRSITLSELKIRMNDKPIIVDVRGFWNPSEAERKGFYYLSL
jgi:UDPglucose 6-dehydrogenase/UDP-N-acetyl-D-galactosamine dehydrogenase